jgi:hypothetical protein
MKREIKIFKNFEEQEAWKVEKSKETTAAQRLANLLYMQNLTKKIHSIKPGKKYIKITHGFITS